MSQDPSQKATPVPSPDVPPRDDKGERATLAPPFDVAAFARRQMGPGSAHGSADQAPSDSPPSQEARAQQITATNELELEKARAESIRLGAESLLRNRTPSALSIVNAQVPSAPNIPVTRAPTPNSIEAAVLGVVNATPPPEITERTIEDPVGEMRERFSLGDYTGALEIAELILADDPGIIEAAECAENCRSVLENMYAARLGPLSRIPHVVVPRAQLRWLSLDHRAGFVLSLIDGTSTVEMILDLSGMPRVDAYRILLELVQQKVLVLRSP